MALTLCLFVINGCYTDSSSRTDQKEIRKNKREVRAKLYRIYKPSDAKRYVEGVVAKRRNQAYSQSSMKWIEAEALFNWIQENREMLGNETAAWCILYLKQYSDTNESEGLSVLYQRILFDDPGPAIIAMDTVLSDLLPGFQNDEFRASLFATGCEVLEILRDKPLEKRQIEKSTYKQKLVGLLHGEETVFGTHLLSEGCLE